MRYWTGRVVCRLFGRHNDSCRGRVDCAKKLAMDVRITDWSAGSGYVLDIYGGAQRQP
jgi:hypothetical protein